MASKKVIQQHVIAYFAWRFDRPPSDFSAKTRVRNAFKNDEAWAALADTFNAMAWMQQIGAKVSQKEMLKTSTIGEVTTLISGKAKGNLKRLTGAEFARVQQADESIFT